MGSFRRNDRFWQNNGAAIAAIHYYYGAIKPIKGEIFEAIIHSTYVLPIFNEDSDISS